MPELPEVQTTVNGIKRYAAQKRIISAWTDYDSAFHAGKSNIKNKKYFTNFKKEVEGKTITNASRIGKNVLIHLSENKTIIIHMKMTGHVMYGRYEKHGSTWRASDPGPLRDDPFNKWIHFVLELNDGKHLVLSDLRKFARVHVANTDSLSADDDMGEIGPDPLDKKFTFEVFKARLMKRPSGKIKQVLLEQSIIAGIGNIYSDEMLWRASIHPLSEPKAIPEDQLKKLYSACKEVLTRGIDFGGDSMSDYRNILGERGKFQAEHNAYQRTGLPCRKRGCPGIISRLKVGGRSAHFCPVHQKLFKWS
jgi:formamidopyrimidine-DNA glycosylase